MVGRCLLSRPALLAFGLVVGLIAAEIAARWLEPDPAEPMMALQPEGQVPDPLLGHRIEPRTGEHDSRGFRNAVDRDRADVVAVGDSQTWGMRTTIEESWPAQLERLSGRSVYNMAQAGYGPVHYRVLVDQALELSPKAIVIGLYFGNDIWDAYRLTYQMDAHERFRHPGPAEREAIRTAPPLRFLSLFGQRYNHGKPSSSIAVFLQERSAVGRLLIRAMYQPLTASHDRAWAREFPEHAFLYEHEGVSTVFHTSYRLTSLDQRSPRIREGLRITELVLLETSAMLREEGIELLVLLIPTKELVFFDSIQRLAMPANESYYELVEMETRLRKSLMSFMNEQEIRYADPLPVQRSAVARNEVLFPENADGHFVAAGYTGIAEAAHRALEEAFPGR